MSHVDDRLADWIIGALPPADAAEVRAHLDTCVPCATAATELQEVLGLLALVVPPTSPDLAVRARLLSSAESGRLHRFAGAIAQMFGVDDKTARAALDAADTAEGWEPSPMPGVLQRLWPGAPEGHLMGFIKIPRGGQVPWHEHLGREHTLVLQGRIVDDDGAVYAPGEAMPKGRGSRHTFFADGPHDLLCGVIIEGGYTLVD